MAQKIGEFSFGVNFEVNTKQLESALDKIRNIDASKMGFTGLDSKQVQEIKNQALEVQKAMSKAFDPKLNTYTFDKFEAALKDAGLSTKTVTQNFAKLGATGQDAIYAITKQLTTTNIQLKQSHALLEKMATTIANTLRWQVATKAIQGMTGAIQQGYYFTKDLDRSLNNIRIVTDKSAASMDKFAVKAAAAAKELGKSTTDYTNASLIYYQQGLGDEEVAKRTETTLKAANVTGQSAAAVSEELTAVWNGFQVSLDETESSIDKLAAVAAHSASNLEEISTAMSKVAATANMTGVSIDQLAAQISTIESVTRQSPETIGTALKTIYARMSDLKLGETDEDGVSLGTVSGTLDSMGVHILDATGQLRDMGTVIEEVAEKWQYLGKEQQTALAESLGGKRQYTNLVALFENWDKYNASLKISQESLGTLQKQQNTYMDSIKAAEQRFATAKEQMQMALWDDDTIKDVNNALAGITESVTKIINVLGGGSGIIKLASSLLAQIMSPMLAQGFSTFVNNFRTMSNQTKTLDAEKNNLVKFAQASGLTNEDKAIQYGENRIAIQKDFADGRIDEKTMNRRLTLLDKNRDATIELIQVENEYANIKKQVGEATEGRILLTDEEINDKNKAIAKINEEIKANQEDIAAYESLKDAIAETESGYITINEALKRNIITEEQAQKLREKQDPALQQKIINQIDEETNKKLDALNKEAEARQDIANNAIKIFDEQLTIDKQIIEDKKQELDYEQKIYETKVKNNLELQQQESDKRRQKYLDRQRDEEFLAREKQKQIDKIKERQASYSSDSPEYKQMEAEIRRAEAERKRAQEQAKEYKRQVNAEKGVKGKITADANDAIKQSQAELEAKKDALNKEAEAAEELTAKKKQLEENTTKTVIDEIDKRKTKIQEESAEKKKDAESTALVTTMANEGITEKASNNEKLTESEQNLASSGNKVSATMREQATATDILNDKTQKLVETIAKNVSQAATSIFSLGMQMSSLSDQLVNIGDKSKLTLSSISSLGMTTVMMIGSISRALKALTITNPWVFAITSALAIGATIISAIKKNIIQAEEELKQKEAERAQKATENAQKIIDAKLSEKEAVDDLNESYTELNEQYQNQEITLTDLRTQTYNLLKSYGDESGAVEALTASYEDLNKIMEDTIRNKNTELITSFNQQEKNLLSDLTVAAQQSNDDLMLSGSYSGNITSGKNVEAIKKFEKATGSKITGQYFNKKSGIYNFSIEDLKKQFKIEDINIDNIDDEIKKIDDAEIQAFLDKQGLTLSESKNQFREELADALANEEEILKVQGHELVNFLDLSKIENWDTDFIEKNIDAILELANGVKTGTIVGDEFTSVFTPERIAEIEKIAAGKTEVKNAELQNELLDIVGYQWTEYEGNVDDTVKDIKDVIKKVYGDLSDEDMQAKLYDIFYQGSHALDLERNLLEAAPEAFKEAYEAAGGINASEELVHQLYHVFSEYGENISKDTLDLLTQAVPTGAEIVGSLAAEFAEKQEISQENLENLYNNQNFIDWLHSNTELTIEEIKLSGSQIRDSIISDYFHSFVGVDTNETKEQIAEQIEDFTKQLKVIEKESHIDDIKDSKAREQAKKQLLESNGDYKALSDAIDKAIIKQNALGDSIINTADDLKIQQQIYEKFNKELDDVQSAYSTLTNVVETYNETGALTLDQVQSLMSMDAQYLNTLFNEEGQLELNKASLERLAEANLSVMRASILKQGQDRADLILKGELDDATLDVFESTTLMNEAIAGGIDDFETAAEKIHTYTQSLLTAHNVQDEIIKQQLLENEEYTINQLRLNEYLVQGDILSSGIADNTAKAADSLEDELDIYHDINVELGKIEKAYSRLEKQREKLVGQELYNSYQEELDLLTAQNDALERKQKLQMEEAERMRNELSAVGVAFDANGEVANYNQILTSWGDQVRANPEDETLKENYDKMKSLLQEYETLWDETIPEVADQIVENSTKQIEAQINKFNFKINLKVTLKDFDREWNDFQKEYLNKVQESDYAKQIESIIKNMQLSYDALGDTTDHLSEINREVEKLKNGAISDIYGDNKALALEDLETYLKNLEDLIKEVTEDLVNANEQYKASVDALAEGFEKQISNLERLNSNYENQIKLAQLMLGEGGAAEEVTKLYEKQSAILQDQAQRLTAEGKYWENEINDIQNKLNSDDLTAESRNNLETMLEEATERMIAANEKAGAAYVSSIEAAQNAMLQNAQAQVNKLSEKVFGTQINAFKLAWEAAKEESEDTLDNIERAYETSQLNAKYTKLINDADLATKQKILNAQREMNERLEEQTELTKDDFEYENKKYELLVAEQQLEDARLNKNTLRLSRDSQGNYTYQYIADAAGVSEAEDKVAQLEYELYELSKSQYYDGINQLLDRFENLPQKVQELGIALEQLTNSGASEDEIAALQGVYDTYVKQLENSTKKVNKSAVRGEETTVNALLKIAQSDNARLLIGGVDYEANRVELERLANSDILSMYQMMIDDKSLAQNLYDNRYKLEQAGLRDWIELEVLDANFFNWSDMNERIQVNNGEVVLVLEEQEQNFADACKELQENIREYNNKTNELILENEAKAVDAYNEVEDAIGDVITKTDTLVTSLTEEADAAKDAWTNIETLAQKYSTLAHNAGVAAAQAAELYKQLQLANEEAAKTPEDYGVKPGDSDGGLPESTYKTETISSIYDKITSGDTKGGAYQAASAMTATNRDLGINVNKGDKQVNKGDVMSKDALQEAFDKASINSQIPITTNYMTPDKIIKTFVKKYDKWRLKEYEYTIGPNPYEFNHVNYYSLSAKDKNNNIIDFHRVSYNDLYKIYKLKTNGNEAYFKNNILPIKDGIFSSSFNTGGYTGEWQRGDRDGKLAFLHQKELVLNAEDTKNLLDTVRINREMMQMQLAAAATQSQTPAAFTSNKGLDQNVHIEANFPNVTNHTEVETALMNLVNYASQQVSIV